MVSGMNLRDYISRMGLTYSSFAEMIGVSQAAVSRYANADITGRIPHRAVIAKIIEATGGEVTVQDFYDQAAKATLVVQAAPAEGVTGIEEGVCP